ncbi:hypothetical protein AVEN_152879-1 [Araneus ventricosus]|uniref:Uncharacterized protein n=1 Tax=Araneus ventricosus TaxID=182803 RepID=A0A4Y2AD79_ARAVE|nr:hypothetical protein AVEN_152879-1 [Araneus ventricosus]
MSFIKEVPNLWYAYHWGYAEDQLRVRESDLANGGKQKTYKCSGISFSQVRIKNERENCANPKACSGNKEKERYKAGRVNIKDLPRPGQAHVVNNSATISAVDELIRQNRWITTREIAVELSIRKGTVHHIIHKKLGYGKVCTQWDPRHLSENLKTVRWELDPSATQEFLH